MMKRLFLIFALFGVHWAGAQVGIGTDPDASAQLDVSASDKGILIPRISLDSLGQSSLDGTHTAATGLMIYNTNAGVGGGKGFYFFDGSRWVQLVPRTRNIAVICIDANQVDVTNTSGSDVSGYDAALEPIFFNEQGKLEVKLVVRYSSVSGTVHFQLRAHNDTSEAWPVTYRDFGIYASTQNGGVATSEWKTWDAGTHAYEIHLFAWVDNSGDHVTVESAYLLVRSQ